MRERWKQAGLLLLSVLAVWLVFYTGLYLLKYHYPAILAPYRSEAEGQLDVAVICLLAYLAAAKWIERRTPTELSPRHALSGLAAGALAGIAMLALVIATLWLAGVYRLQGWGTFDGLASGIVLTLAAAAREEILYRGLLFRLYGKVFGTWAALLLMAVTFAAMHANNTGATFTGLLNVALAGVLLGAAYAASGRLWLPIGLHFGWNFAQTSLFGTAMSGFSMGPGLIAGRMSGPDILTGGKFGPEGSIVAVIVVLAVTIYLVWRIAKLRRAEPPLWRQVEGSKQ